jgi:hypothetical protein
MYVSPSPRIAIYHANEYPGRQRPPANANPHHGAHPPLRAAHGPQQPRRSDAAAHPPLADQEHLVALQVLDLYADQLGRSEEIDMLVDTLMKRVKVVVEASQVAWSVRGMVDCLVASAGVDGQLAIEG